MTRYERKLRKQMQKDLTNKLLNNQKYNEYYLILDGSLKVTSVKEVMYKTLMQIFAKPTLTLRELHTFELSKLAYNVEKALFYSQKHQKLGVIIEKTILITLNDQDGKRFADDTRTIKVYERENLAVHDIDSRTLKLKYRKLITDDFQIKQYERIKSTYTLTIKN